MTQNIDALASTPADEPTWKQRAVERSPSSKEIVYHLGMAELRNGQTELARRHLKTALSGSPTFAGADEARATLAALGPSAG